MTERPREIPQTAGGGSLRVLCISPWFVPLANSEAFCGGKLARALIESGVDIEVIHCSNYFRTSHLDSSASWRVAMGASVDVRTPVERQRVRSLVAGARYRSLSFARWIPAVVKQSRLMHEHKPFDLVYSRSLPYVAHIAGYWTAKALSLPWVANINDPWDFPRSFRDEVHGATWLTNSLSDSWLRRTLATANVVTYPSERLRDYHRRRTRIDHPAAVIPHVGCFASERSLAGPQCDDALHFVHAGKLGSNESIKRDSQGLLAGLSLFLDRNPEVRSRIVLTLVGSADPETQSCVERLRLGSVVRTTGSVSYDESIRYIRDASVCVLVEGNIAEGIFLASKLAYYLSLGKPVLALSPRAGVAADLAKEGGITRVDVTDAESVAAEIARYYDDFCQGNLATRAPSSSLRSMFEPQVIAKQFLEVARQAEAAHKSDTATKNRKRTTRNWDESYVRDSVRSGDPSWNAQHK